jgi:hypothetical protein
VSRNKVDTLPDNPEDYLPASDDCPLVMTRREAAKICRISVQTFDAWIRKGVLPGPIPGTRRWSRVTIERALAGDMIASIADAGHSAFEQWKRRNAR